MAIQNRRGANADFDSTKMLPGELAVTTDGSRKVYVAFAPGDVKELASAEEVKESVQNGIEEIEQKKKEVLAEIPDYEERLAELEIYKANSIIVTSSGTTFRETDCAAVSPVNIKLFGKGKQETVPGNQLFDASRIPTTTIGNVTLTNNGDGSLTISGEGVLTENVNIRVDHSHEETIKLVKSGILTMLLNTLVKPYFYVHFYYDNGSKRADITCFSQPDAFAEITEEMLDDTCYMVVGIYGYTGDGIISGTVKPMLYQDGDGTWEPYVGGEASPNMNYPQIPEFLGESGSIAGKVLSGNIFDGNKLIEYGFSEINENEYYISHSATPYGKRLFENTFGYKGQIYIKGYIKWTIYQSNPGVFPEIHYTDGTVDYSISNINADGVYKEIDFVTDSTKVVEHIMCSYGTGSSDTYIKDMQMSFIDSEEFEPYTEQPFTVLTPNGLRGIPLGTTIPDAIANSDIHMSGVYWDEEEGQYYIGDYRDYNSGKDVQLITEFTVDGGEENGQSWWVYSSYDGFARNVMPFIGSRRDGFCNQALVRTTASGLLSQNGMWLGVDNNVVYLINNSFFDSTLEDYGLANLKAHLDENPLVITTWLDEPIITDTSSEELAEYNALVMNYPNTTIVNDAGAYMEVTHVKDTQKHIEQNYVSKAMYEEHESRIAELEKAIVNS